MPQTTTEAPQNAVKAALAKGEPVFINQQTTVVSVFNEQRTRVDVHPIGAILRHSDGNYYVIGEHYRQFVGRHGQLTFLDPAKIEARALARLTSGSKDDAVSLGQKIGDPVANPRPSMIDKEARRPLQAPPPAPVTPPVLVAGPLTETDDDAALDSATTEAIIRAFPSETPEVRADVAAYIIQRRHDKDGAVLPAALGHFKQRADVIADGDADPAPTTGKNPAGTGNAPEASPQEAPEGSKHPVHDPNAPVSPEHTDVAPKPAAKPVAKPAAANKPANKPGHK